MKNEGLKALSEYSHGILSFPCCLSLQQKQETPHAMTIMRMTETHPTMSSSFKLIWQFRPANQGLHSHLTTWASSGTHLPFLLHKSHSVVVAKIQDWSQINISKMIWSGYEKWTISRLYFWFSPGTHVNKLLSTFPYFPKGTTIKVPFLKRFLRTFCYENFF